MSHQRHGLIALLVSTGSVGLLAQDRPPRAKFDVVSIKPNTSGTRGGSARTLPDGSDVLVNQPIGALLLAASPVQTREVVGAPDWVTFERYDITLKPPAGATTPTQRREMMQAMFADRMKLVAHVEQHERDVYSLLLARSDGRLGPELKPSTLDCSPPRPGAPVPAPPQGPLTAGLVMSRCGMMMRPGGIMSGGMRLNGFAASLYGLVGAEVENHTGLEGFYSVNLTFSATRGRGLPVNADATDDAPDIFTAVREQLGLKLERERKMMPVFVIDHIERPSEN
jgi:uncharacterized protein (TIGR03435 family)